MTQSNPQKKIVFLFSGASNRRTLLAEVARGENADTGLRGLNYLPGAAFIDIEETVRGMVPGWVYGRLPWQARSLFLYRRVLQYDVVIAQDDLLLGYLVSLSARVLRTRSRWVCIAINTSVLIQRHQAHSFRLRLLTTIWRSFAHIVCLSSAQLEDFVRIGISRERLTLVPFGVDADFFAAASGVEEGLVVSVGRDLGRDYVTLFQAAAQTPHPFVVVAAHKNIGPDLAVPPNVTVLYNKPLAEVRALYARAAVVVVISKREQVPEGSDCSGQTVILDAMAAGKPVITTERSWIKDYFVPGQDLLVIAPDSPEALVRSLGAVFADEALRSRIAQAGQAKVRAHYTTRKFAQALERVVQGIHD